MDDRRLPLVISTDRTRTIKGVTKTAQITSRKHPRGFLRLIIHLYPMNIVGRVVGGILILISFAWLGTLAGIRPFLGMNQVQSGSATPVSANNASSGKKTAIVSANATNTSKTKAQTLDTQVQTNPRDSGAKAVPQTTTPTNSGITPASATGTATGTTAKTSTTGQTATSKAPVVQAGW